MKTASHATKIAFGKFSPMSDDDDGSCEVIVDGKCVGEIKRATKWDFAHASSRARVGKVVGYTVEIMNGSMWSTDPHAVHASIAVAKNIARTALAPKA
jgi:hypothetical protein